MRRKSTLVPTFAAPFVLALLSLFGLVGALLADGRWDWIGAALLAAAPGAALWVRLRR